MATTFNPLLCSLHHLDFLFRQPIQLVYQRVDLLIRHVNLALDALARRVALRGLLLLVQV